MMERLEERKVLASAEGWFAETDGKEVWPQKFLSLGGRLHCMVNTEKDGAGV